MLIYDHREGKVLDLIDFRPTRSTDIGIGVPGFLAGLALAHQLHGSLPWETLLAPSIQIARYFCIVVADEYLLIACHHYFRIISFRFYVCNCKKKNQFVLSDLVLIRNSDHQTK